MMFPFSNRNVYVSNTNLKFFLDFSCKPNSYSLSILLRRFNRYYNHTGSFERFLSWYFACPQGIVYSLHYPAPLVCTPPQYDI